MFSRVLIANRGEIACRVIQTCRRLGITAIAVYSEADANARHVRLADESVCIGAAPPADSYLNIPNLLGAASDANAETIHPGYGFLSESPEFARACADADIVFVGPAAATMEKMGAKADAKRLMDAAGVPTVPGYHGENQDDDFLFEQAREIGFPLMIKASAGGGGKGMRIVEHADEFASSLQAARRESMGAFGDDSMILERYLQNPRHIEFQIFGDTRGNVVHVFERECSIQRRYQKIIEETPSPFLDEGKRAVMADAAVAAARAVDYVGAGTVEFITDADRNFYFMEMNTRLQVEHPVTELTTGLDLVEWQLRVAAGEALPLTQKKITRHGHAIEARVYAEDPEKGFLPSAGRLELVAHPVTGPAVRWDSAVDTGDTVSVYYDPMIAKLIVGAGDRVSAIAGIRDALADTAVVGCTTNLDFLERVAGLDAFAAAEIDTGFLDRHLEELTVPREIPLMARLVAAAAYLLDIENRARSGTLGSADSHSPWGRADAWRLNHFGHRQVALVSDDGERVDVDAEGYGGRYRMRVNGKSHDVTAETADGYRLTVDVDGDPALARAFQGAGTVVVSLPAGRFRFSEFSPYSWTADEGTAENRVTAPMPGKIVAVRTKEGASVREGDELIIMEAMKMEITLRAPHAGRVERVLHETGDFVEAEVALIELSGGED